MMVAFHFHFSIAPGIQLTMTVVPHWSFYAFLLATMGTMVIGHFALACHRYVSEDQVPLDDTSTEAVMNHAFTVDVCFPVVNGNTDVQSGVDDGDTVSVCSGNTVEEEGSSSGRWQVTTVRLTSLGKVTMVLILLLCVAAVLTGTIVETTTFQFKGLTGYLMKHPIESYSFIDIGNEMPASSGIPHNFGVRFIQLAYYLFALAMPVAFLIALVFLWVTPLSQGTQKGVVVLAEMVNAWNALDVFVISTIAAVVEIRQFAQFLVGDNCDLMNKYLEEYMSDELDGDGRCFDVIAVMKTVRKNKKIKKDYIILSIIMYVVSLFVVFRTCFWSGLPLQHWSSLAFRSWLCLAPW
jgi:hypothetical protein